MINNLHPDYDELSSCSSISLQVKYYKNDYFKPKKAKSGSKCKFNKPYPNDYDGPARVLYNRSLPEFHTSQQEQIMEEKKLENDDELVEQEIEFFEEKERQQEEELNEDLKVV